jgi:maltose O-acetyltransferase
MKERMLAGDLYQSDDAELVSEFRAAQRLTDEINSLGADDDDRRLELQRQLFGEFGPDSEIRSPFHCDYGYPTKIGARVFANFGLVILDAGPVTIGDDVQIGPNVQIVAATHPLEPEARREKWESSAPISIGDNVWLGASVVVCPGVTIGRDSVVAAGAVVTKDVQAGVLVAGVPAQVIREL